MAEQQQQQQQQQQQLQELLKCLTSDETAAEFFRRHGREALATGLPCIDAFVRLRPGHLVELVGPAGAAKTELLMQVWVGALAGSAAAAPPCLCARQRAGAATPGLTT
jgi:F0F1-type ATP synthase beta subunit